MNIKFNTATEKRFKFFVNGKEYYCIAANDGLEHRFKFPKVTARLFFGDRNKSNPAYCAIKTTVPVKMITQEDVESIAKMIGHIFNQKRENIRVTNGRKHYANVRRYLKALI